MPRSMMNSSSTRVALPIRHGTSRSTVYFGGGTSIWVIALIPMIGRLNRLSVSASDRPPLECSRLWNCSRRHSAGVRSSALDRPQGVRADRQRLREADGVAVARR